MSIVFLSFFHENIFSLTFCFHNFQTSIFSHFIDIMINIYIIYIVYCYRFLHSFSSHIFIYVFLSKYIQKSFSQFLLQLMYQIEYYTNSVQMLFQNFLGWYTYFNTPVPKLTPPTDFFPLKRIILPPRITA